MNLLTLTAPKEGRALYVLMSALRGRGYRNVVSGLKRLAGCYTLECVEPGWKVVIALKVDKDRNEFSEIKLIEPDGTITTPFAGPTPGQASQEQRQIQPKQNHVSSQR